MSSKTWGTSKTLGGVFDGRSVLGEANLAFLAYCTSDGHMGDASATPVSYNWQFRGQETVKAAIAELVKQGMGSGSTFVLGGSSAGGRGTMVTCDFLPSLLPTGVDFVCVPDSPLWIDMPSLVQTPLAVTAQKVYTMANASGRVSAECGALYSGPEAWKCLFGQFRMPSLAQPYLMYASQDDAFQLGWDLGSKPQTPAQLAFAANFSNITVGVLESLTSPTVSAVFSSKCYNHAVSCTDTYLTETVQGLTMDDAMRIFLQAVGVSRTGSPKTTRLHWADNCTGFACGPGCQ